MCQCVLGVEGGGKRAHREQGPSYKRKKNKNRGLTKKIPKRKGLFEGGRIKRVSSLQSFTTTKPICSTKIHRKKKDKEKEGASYNSSSSHHPLHLIIIGLSLLYLSFLFLYIFLSSFSLLFPFAPISSPTIIQTPFYVFLFILPFHNLFIKLKIIILSSNNPKVAQSLTCFILYNL